ncbi:MAG TPA: SNF2 helicase-associated domain-containing protein, partial [Pilimelia sp.]|nr:SNF2 helicase-associated domain-containing protein [Pilimelia sp.]
MLTVHGAWLGDGLLLWAEHDGETPPAPARRGRGPRPHPFAVPAAQLAAAFDGAAPGTHLAHLPAFRSGPVPSPDSGRTAAGRTPRLAAWQVPTVRLDPAGALLLLTALAPDAQPGAAEEDAAGDPGAAERQAPAWQPGGSLRYLAVLAGYARDVARRGRLLPQLVAESGGYAARWRPVRTGADVQAHTDLLAAMPAACRALSAPGDPAPGVGETLDGALAALVDAAARRLLPDRLLRTGRPGARAEPAERWLWALTADDPAVPLARAEAEALARPLRRWFDAAHAEETGTRVCFRLVEPVGPDAVGPVDNPVDNGERWRVEWALQSVDDPSLYVPAADLWAGARPPGLPAHPEEVLLAGLGRAVRLFPALHGALGEPRPAAWTTDTAGAHAFLRDHAPLLRAAGFGVQLPAWAGRAALGVKLTARQQRAAGGPGAVAAGGVGAGELVDFRLDLALGGEVLDEAELAALAAQKVPLVRVRGRWVELDEKQLPAALAVWRRRRAGTLTVAEVLREVTGGPDVLPVAEVDADGVLGDVLSGALDERLTPTPSPPGLAGTLRPYQQRGLSWLAFLSRAGLGGVLADDMGLGKTVSTLALLLHERPAPAPTLLVCPMSLLSNWEKEAGRFAPDLRVLVHHGAGR